MDMLSLREWGIQVQMLTRQITLKEIGKWNLKMHEIAHKGHIKKLQRADHLTLRDLSI